ncbi:MAG TPA: hypothetical protein EYH15_00030 [Methanothermococcus okinawensis]|uniref:Uncharacterized protein n=1 Tax=Methanothermococcus okinawensis TaxID=155863 RepID=A0A832ZJF5_9EURY|nr:hypothetical protein [Methanococcaceae archaeon]HIP83875.1 hypothetical protein [Methanothermococcus okinawensis]HIP91333.1 hypothetical protein [Methanothermococcus okinawensis]
MSLFPEGDHKKLDELRQMATRVLRDGYDIVYEPYEKRVELWNRIKENYERYKEGECGRFLRDIDNAVRREFEWALAILAYSFHHNGESFPGVNRYKPKELQLVDYILRYNVFEIWTVEDILREISRANRKNTDETLNLLKEYYNGIGDRVEEIIKDHTVRLPLRDYGKTKWMEYKNKMDEAILRGMREIDWFRDFINNVDSKIQKLEDDVNKLHDFLRMERELERSKIEELKREFERKKEKIRMEIEREKNKELQEKLKREIESVEREYRELIHKLNKKVETLESEKKELSDILIKIKSDREEGTRFVKAESALFYEEWFIGRLEKRLEELKRRGIVIGNKTFKVEVIEEIAPLGEIPNIPRNREIRAVLSEKKLLPIGRRTRIILKGIFLANRENYKKMGFDIYPISLAKIIEVIEEGKKEEVDKVVLIIASPTGFEDEVITFVNSQDFKRRYLSKKIALILLDVGTGDIYYNEMDEYARVFGPLMNLEFDMEKVERLREYIRKNLLTKGYITWEEAVKVVGDERIVNKVFEEYRKAGEGKTSYIKDVGYVLLKNN